MSRYIIRRLLQAIPLLFIISIILFILMMNMGDPLATMGGRDRIRADDRELEQHLPPGARVPP